MKKRATIISFAILLILLLSIVTYSEKENADNDKLNILTTFYPIHIFTQNVTDGIDVEVKSLDVKTSGCLHGYHLTAGNMKDIENADVIVINGAEMEKTFIYDIQEMYPNKKIIDTSYGVKLLNSKFEDEVNSHIWLSVENAKIQVANIASGLSEYDGANAYSYIENSNKYISKLDELKPDNRELNIVAMHDSISYFAKELNLNVVDIIQHDEEDTPTQKRINEIIQNMKDNKVNAILIENNYSDKLATLIAEETGLKIYYFDSITDGNGGKEDYFVKMKNNYETILSIDEAR